MELPSFDTRTPTNPVFGPLSIWLCGDSPWDSEERPTSMHQLAERLGVDYVKLVNIRRSKAFRAFHRKTTSNLDEIVERRQEVINVLYEQAMSGNVTAARTYLQLTQRAEVMAEQGQDGAPQDTMSTDDLKQLTDDEFAALVANFNSTD